MFLHGFLLIAHAGRQSTEAVVARAFNKTINTDNLPLRPEDLSSTNSTVTYRSTGAVVTRAFHAPRRIMTCTCCGIGVAECSCLDIADTGARLQTGRFSSQEVGGIFKKAANGE